MEGTRQEVVSCLPGPAEQGSHGWSVASEDSYTGSELGLAGL